MIALHEQETMVVGAALLGQLAAHGVLAARRADRLACGNAPGHVLRYPAVWRVGVVLGGTAVIAIALLVAGRGNPFEGAARVVLALVGAGAILEVLFTRIRVLPEGIERRSPWCVPALFRWRDVSGIELRADLGWLALRTRSGGTVRISRRLADLRAFAAFALAHLPHEALARDPIARSWLEDRARVSA